MKKTTRNFDKKAYKAAKSRYEDSRDLYLNADDYDAKSRRFNMMTNSEESMLKRREVYRAVAPFWKRPFI